MSLCVFKKVSPGFSGLRLCLDKMFFFQHRRFSDVFSSEKAIFQSHWYTLVFLASDIFKHFVLFEPQRGADLDRSLIGIFRAKKSTDFLKLANWLIRSSFSYFDKIIRIKEKNHPGSTLHGYLSKILVRSCQDLGKILATIFPRYWQELQDVMVRSYQENHVPKKTFIVKSHLERKNLKGSQQKSTFLQIYIVRH